MMELQGDCLLVEGGVTIETVPEMVGSISDYLIDGIEYVDLSGVTEVDSSAVALLLEWQRQAVAHGISLKWRGIPAALQNLADLYGVQAILSVET